MTPTQQKAYQEWAYSLALQAATYGAPLVTMYALRYNDAVGPKAKARPIAIWRMENISHACAVKTSRLRHAKRQHDYGFGFMDYAGADYSGSA